MPKFKKESDVNKVNIKKNFDELQKKIRKLTKDYENLETRVKKLERE